MIDGRYRLMKMIGEGGMGRVYAAEHVGIGKQVALKILHAVFANTKEAVERFRGEARLTSKVASAHIVDVTDSGTTADGRLYFVMEHLDGVELSEAMRDGTLSLERSLHIARQIADALAAAHAQGVIHRDLKPENILLITRENDRDFVKVLDFGIATTIGGEGPNKRRLTQPGLAVGTPEYMAPEQALDAKADERSDIYALGTILYEMATGQPAYQGDTFTKVLVDKVNSDPPRPRERRPELPAEVEAIIVKAMARKAGERHQSMKELSAEISACAGALSRPVSMPAIVLPPPDLESPPPAPPAPPPVSARAMLLEPVDPNGATVAMTVDRPRPRRGGIIPLVLVMTMALGGAVALYVLVLRPSTDQTREGDGTPPTATLPAIATSPGPARATPKPKPPKPAVAAETPAKPAVADETPAKPAAADETPAKPAPPPKTAKQARLLVTKAQAAAKKKSWDPAREMYERVSRGRFDPERGHLGLAQVALATGDAKAAQKHAKTAVRLGGGSPARKVLAQANAKLKKKR